MDLGIGARRSKNAPNTYLKTAVKMQQKNLETTVKRIFKNANFVARLFFEAIFERASQKEKQ